MVLAVRVAALAALVASPAIAQQKFPSKPVRIITSVAGGPYDVVMRATGVPLSLALGQPVIVENRAGGSFVPVADGCAKAVPDGHTLCALDSFMMAVNPLLIANIPYNAYKDFTPIVFIGSLNAGLMVSMDLPVRDLPDLLAQAKAHRTSSLSPRPEGEHMRTSTSSTSGAGAFRSSMSRTRAFSRERPPWRQARSTLPCSRWGPP